MKTGKNKNKGFTLSELLFVFLIVMVTSVFLFPVIRYTRLRLKQTICANNLREIGLALYIYAKEHEGKFPPDIKTLYKEQYLSDIKLVDCPGSKIVGLPENPDYIYTSGLSVRNESLLPLLRDATKNHFPKGKNILYVNGTVSWKE
ncbi:MAG: type II secretion system protein [Candidatus Omnitrophota bacterium]